jgi:serine/threonine protein kinase
MAWPSGQDYREAIQAPSVAFKDSELRRANVECDRLGLPRPRSGGFATVYKATDSKTWAVRCFNRQVDDQQERYAAISDFLQQRKLPYMVDFTFLKEGIRVKGNWYPILKMEWISGDPLHVFIERNLGNPNALLRLAQSWVAMVDELQQAGIAHGDLQHGNVLVVGNSLKLIDYDGMFVPTLKGKPSAEVGQPNYQLPIRGVNDFGPYLDNFSAWVILISIVATAHNPNLWTAFKGGDECLLFRRRDFEAPDHSPLFQSLTKSRDSQIAALANLFRTFLSLTCATVPPLTSVGPIANIALEQIPQPSDWIKDHISKPSAKEKATYIQAGLPADWILDFTEPPPTPFSLTDNYARERFFLWLSVIAVVLPAFISSWVLFSIAAIVVGGMCAFYLGMSYSKQPTLGSLRTLKENLESNRNQSSHIQLEIKKYTKRLQEIRNEELQRKAVLIEHRQKLENEERKSSDKTRKDHQARIAPILRDRKRLDSQESSELAALHNGLGKKVLGLKTTISTLQQTEATELANVLKIKQNDFLKNALSKERIYDASIPGIGSGFKARLHAAGFLTAADVDYYRVQRVPGIGVKKAANLFAWRQLIENSARQHMPQSLSSIEQSSITAKYATSRLNLQTELAREERQLKSEELAIRSRYTPQREKIDATVGNDQNKLTLELGQIASDFKGKYQAITRETEISQKRADEQAQSNEQKISALTRELAVLQWKRARLERERQRYTNVRPSRYLRAVAIGR